jgi:hypothetical protein
MTTKDTVRCGGARGLVAAGLVLCVFTVCYNPFYPPTGEPIKSNARRSTPVGVIEQLYTSYENRQISLFSDLFSPLKKDFRFYVSPVFFDNVTTNHTIDRMISETVDSSFEYVWKRGVTKAYYWTYDEELQMHTKMFSQASEIGFSMLPQPIDSSSVNYITGPDGTAYAEVVMRGGGMIVRQPYAGGAILELELDIGEQVFYLEKDPADTTLWVIAKWFDLGTAASIPSPY